MRVPRGLLSGAAGVALALLWIPSQAAAQSTRSSTTADTVRGRVAVDSGAPLANVVIRVVALPDSAIQTTKTDARGTFSVTFDRAAASYVVSASLIGYQPDTVRVRRPANASATSINLNVRMRRLVQTLRRVQTTAKRPRPAFDLMGDAPTPGEASTIVDPNGTLSGDVTGDLNSLLATIPGLTVTPNSDGSPPDISIAGLSSDQNSISLNGVNTGATVPRDGDVLLVRTSSYDPSQGASGVQINQIIPSRGYSSEKSLHATLEAPALQWTTPDAERLGREYTMPTVSGNIATWVQGMQGLLHSQSTAFQFSRRTSDLVSLTNASGASLAAIGIAPDSATRLRETLAQLGIPTSVRAMPSERVSTQGMFLTRLNFGTRVANPYRLDPDGAGLTRAPGALVGTGAPTSADLTVLVGGSVTDNQSINISPTSLPSRGGNARRYNANIQANRAADLGPAVNEFNTAVSVTSSRSTPYLNLPSAAVLLQSQLPDGRSAYTTVQAAGAATGPSNSEDQFWNVVDKIKWATFDGAQQFQMSLDGTVDHYALSQTPSAGSYFYNSLSDLAANQPASFTRAFESVASHGTSERGALGLSDTQILSRAHSLSAIYGLRIEDEHFNANPMFNPAVDSLFGLRTDHVPSALTVSPMAGFTWTYAQLNGQPDARRQLFGGVRDYRGTFSPQSLDPYIRRTGLDVSSEQLQCFGAAVPVPDWSALVASPASIADACADSAGASPLSIASPTVAVFAPNYVPSHSVRANLTWTGVLGSSLTYSVHGMEAVNSNMPGTFDANFTGASRFTLPDEDGRPVYVEPSSIVPTSGSVSPADSRVSSRFGQVSERQSDGRYRNGLVTTQLNYQPLYNPRSAALSGAMSVSYTYSAAQSFVNGFTGTTNGDPRINEWNTSSASRHTVIISSLLRVPSWVAISGSVIVRSGAAFTPRVNSDLNGDGYANDRAFIFDPNTVSDPAVAAAMRALLASAPTGARDCLRRQLGAIADANSCTGPWAATLNLRAGLDAYRLGFKNRGSVSLILNNALGAADQLLHGSSGLHGWGQSAFPDPTLFEVRGFDPSTRRFIYNVNPQFGSTTLSRAGYRAPFTIVLDARFDLGPNHESAFLRGFLRDVADSEQHDDVAIKKRIMRIAPQTVPLEGVISEASTLGVTPEQAQVFRDADAHYEAERDRIYTDFSSYVAGLKGDYDSDAITAKWHVAMRTLVLAQGDLGDLLRSTLTPAQIQHALAINAISAGRGYLMYDRAMLERLAQGRLNPI
ncbi:MAG TPA: TonB-dependent receptor [Gemmatimonadaceae bacterium]